MNFYWNEILIQEDVENGIYIETANGKYIVTQEELDNANQMTE